MPEADDGSIAHCQACGSPMEVSAVGPFTRVECPSCGEQTRVKTTFGPYTLNRRHAVGGMSMVYVADDPALGREVVVKILSEDFSADEKRIAAFEEEARITAAISHPNVVRVFTTGRAFGRFYIGMEFVQGGHFEHHIRERGKIPEAEILPVAIQVAQGLKAAKAAGLIHRDVKPGNILLDAGGAAKLVDFGLALVTQGGKATATELWATPYYVPPETIEGGEEDFRSDIYAFGATFYHALAGTPPCNEETMDTDRLREAKRHVKPLEKVTDEVSMATCHVIDRCMAYAPEDRFGSYDELLGALKDAERGMGVAMPTPSARGRRRSRERSGLLIGGAVALLLALVAVPFVLGKKKNEGPEPIVTEAVEGPVATAEESPTTESSGLEVSKLYQRAASALVAHDFHEAGRLYGEVRDHPGVLEPTGSWAACEAVAAAWLDGDSVRARREVGRALEHIEAATSLDPAARDTLVAGLPRLLEMSGIDRLDGSGRLEVDLLVSWLAALKDWDQGLLDLAEPMLRQAADASEADAGRWLGPHRDLAAEYLNDLSILRAAEPETFEMSQEEAGRLSVELEAVHTRLKTKGRAKFNVRCWQLELARAAKRKPVEESAEPERDPSVFPEDAMVAVEKCRFDEAQRLLLAWVPTDAPGQSRRASLLWLVEQASGFLKGFENIVDRPSVPMATRDGRRFSGVLTYIEGGLLLTDQAGNDTRVGWADLEPDGLVELHRFLTRSADGGREVLLGRHRQAVAFDLLVGDANRAREAGDRLAELDDDPDFEKLWKRASSAVWR